MSLRFQCEHCQEVVIVKYLTFGEKAKCGNCGKLSIVPSDAVSEAGKPDNQLSASDPKEGVATERPHVEDLLNYLARHANAPQFYGLSIALIIIYLILRLALPVPETIESFISFIHSPLAIFLHVGFAISGLIGVSSLMIKVVARFRYGFYFLDIYSESPFRYRKSSIFFIIAAVAIEFLIDVWFLFE